IAQTAVHLGEALALPPAQQGEQLVQAAVGWPGLLVRRGMRPPEACLLPMSASTPEPRIRRPRRRSERPRGAAGRETRARERTGGSPKLSGTSPASPGRYA